MVNKVIIPLATVLNNQPNNINFFKESPYKLNSVMGSALHEPTWQIARFPEKSTHRKKLFKRLKPVVQYSKRLELKNLVNKYRKLHVTKVMYFR